MRRFLNIIKKHIYSYLPQSIPFNQVKIVEFTQPIE